jgi:hypothetical protein
MALLLERLLGLLGLKPRKTRLSDEQAIEIAAAYAESEGFPQFDRDLFPFEMREIDGRLVWLMRTPTVGRWVVVSIDDASGEVLGHKVHGIR